MSWVVQWLPAVPQGFSRPSGFPVLRGHNGLMWLAAKGGLTCLLLKQVVDASFAIQLLAASEDD